MRITLKRNNKKIFYLITLTLLGTAVIQDASAKKIDAKLEWRDLRKLKKLSKIPRKLSKVNGGRVTLPGFMVPLDGDEDGVGEFLLVPSQGQCIHVPPPPPNQMVHVKMQKVKTEFTWQPIIVEGTFKIKKFKSPFGDALFTIKGFKVKPFKPGKY